MAETLSSPFCGHRVFWGVVVVFACDGACMFDDVGYGSSVSAVSAKHEMFLSTCEFVFWESQIYQMLNMKFADNTRVYDGIGAGT